MPMPLHAWEESSASVLASSLDNSFNLMRNTVVKFPALIVILTAFLVIPSAFNAGGATKQQTNSEEVKQEIKEAFLIVTKH